MLGHEVLGDVIRAGDSIRPGDRMVVAEAFELVAAGAVRVAELGSHRLPVERLDDAARLMERREALKVYGEVGGR